MDETRGTLFWNILKILEAKTPAVVILENVRNIAGPRHMHEWEVIIQTLRDLGYRVSEDPHVVSPHLIKPEFGGRPQVRERVFIAATLIPKGIPNFKSNVEIPDLTSVKEGWDPQSWNLEKHLPLDKLKAGSEKNSVELSIDERDWLEAWNEFVLIMREKLGDANLPGFPIWADHWVHIDELKIPRGTPDWKKNFLIKNAEFYTAHRVVLNKWLKKWDNLENFPPSRRKLEWQAQDTKSLWETVMHLRPSGIRAKKATYVPALVAITQTSIVGKNRNNKRRLTVREGARLQGFPEWFNFYEQKDSASFKQLGNAVNVGVIFQAMKALVERDYDLLADAPALLKAITTAPHNPDLILSNPGNLLHNPKKPKVVQEELTLKLVN
jgi:DNA (cytosine-5)-methyltransferase 1